MFKLGFAAGALDRPSFSRRTSLLIDTLQLLLILGLLLALLCAPAHAGNTVFLTDKNGQITFPLSPPNRATSGPGLIDNMTIGATTPRPGTFTALNFTGQLLPTGGVPTIASGDCGTSTNGAVVAGSTNMSGSITIGATATTTCKITFAAGLTVAPKACVFFPMNATAAATGTTVARVGAPTLTDVTLTGSALASSNYAYHCQ